MGSALYSHYIHVTASCGKSMQLDNSNIKQQRIMLECALSRRRKMGMFRCHLPLVGKEPFERYQTE